MSAFHYYQMRGGEEAWQAVPVSHKDELVKEHKPVFVTVLSVSKLVEDMSSEEKLKLAYDGPFYCDFDSEDEGLVIIKVNEFLDKLEDLGVDLTMLRLYATGGRGYHIEVPQRLFLDKLPKNGIVGLPMIYRELALSLVVDTLDLKIYSAGRGRMWRTPNVQRDNGRFKVPIRLDEMREMTPELNVALTGKEREVEAPTPPEFCVQLSVEFSKACQKVEELLKKRAKFKPDPLAREKAKSHSVQWMMAGIGIKTDVGFQQIATQLAIAAVTAGMSEEQLVIECAGLIESHVSDSRRYGTPALRAQELRRMFRYMEGNPCYEFSIGAIKSLLTHSAPDLDGIPASKEDIQAEIKAAEEFAGEAQEVDEYGDVAKGVYLSRYGIYKDTEFGKVRICALSFTAATVLRSAESSQIVGYDADVLVNGASRGRCTLELDVFSGLVQFNRFASKYGHAFQGSDAQVRTVMMRFVEQAKKHGNISYVVTREGLDIVSIPNHEDEELRQPFMVWADHKGVTVEPRIAEKSLNIKFAGFPDPRGVFKTDISDAPRLVPWLQEDGNKDLLRDTLRNLMTCQKPEVLGKLLGWYTACYWKQLFQKHYLKFPLLHVNGPAGLGKTELNISISSLFYYQNESRPLSPGSTNFALLQHLMSSSSIPLILDEYKPHEMVRTRVDALKGMFRDVYNQRDTARGGGTRETDDYRVLQFSQMAAPMVFIAEAAEEEAAVMERVVMVTLARPSQQQGLRNLARFQEFVRNRQVLGIMGQYIAGSIIEDANREEFMAEFDALYAEAKGRFMLTEADLEEGKLSADELQDKQNTKERPVYNHTVARFGFRQFRKLVRAAVGDDLEELMDELEDGIYSRLTDLHSATTPEYVKVLRDISSMTYHVEADRPEAMRKGFEYQFVEIGGRACVEVALRNAYGKYRMHCRSMSANPLFASAEPFIYAVQDSPAFLKKGTGEKLPIPGVFTFLVDELARLGVDAFK